MSSTYEAAGGLLEYLSLGPDRKPPDDIVFAFRRSNRDIWEPAVVISFNYRKTKRQKDSILLQDLPNHQKTLLIMNSSLPNQLAKLKRLSMPNIKQA